MRIVSWNVNGIRQIQGRMPLRIPDKSQRYQTGFDLSESLVNVEKLMEQQREAGSVDAVDDEQTQAGGWTEDEQPYMEQQQESGFVAASALPSSLQSSPPLQPRRSPSATDSALSDVPQFSAMQRAVQDPGVPTVRVSTLLELLNSLCSDIVCLQETKLFSRGITASLVQLNGWDSYWSCYRGKNKSGYSGVVTYCKSSTVAVGRVEEGFTGLLSSGSSSSTSVFGCTEELYANFSSNELRELDSEGRCIITEHVCRTDPSSDAVSTSFLLFNVYLPNAGSDIRDDFKLRYYYALQCRLESLIAAGYHIVLCGDVNTAHQRLDHCDPNQLTVKAHERSSEPFEKKRSRQWMTKLLRPHGLFVDVFRVFHSQQAKRYTCWNTITNARMGNFGTRIDYFVADGALVDSELFTDCDVWSDVPGSDHCPVSLDINAATMLYPPSAAHLSKGKLSSLCGRTMMEQSGNQKSLKSFLAVGVTPSAAPPALPTPSSDIESGDELLAMMQTKQPATSQGTPTKSSTGTPVKRSNGSPTGNSTLKRAKTSPAKTSTLLAFFHKPAASSNQTEQTEPQPTAESRNVGATQPAQAQQSPSAPDGFFDEMLLASAAVSHQQHQQQSKQWASLFARDELHLLCKQHQVVCKKFKVNKKGPNQNREFYCCIVPPPDRCKTWMWSVEAEKYIKHRKEQAVTNANGAKGVIAPN